MPIFKIMTLRSTYKNLEGFKVAQRQKKDFFSKRFLPLLFSVNSYNQKLPNRHTRQSDDTFDTFGGVPEVIPFLKIAPQFQNLHRKIRKSYFCRFFHHSASRMELKLIEFLISFHIYIC